MKQIIVALALTISTLALFTSACSKTASDSGTGGSGGGGGLASYTDCDQPPTGSVKQNATACSAGTWNNYEVVENSGGTVLTNKYWCGGSVADHPASQSAYDGSMVPGGSTSNADYKSSTVCVSGSSTSAGGNKTRNIWQLQ